MSPEWIGIGLTILAAAIGYGELRGKVKGQDDKAEIILRSIQRLDDRIAELTDFLLREHGKGL